MKVDKCIKILVEIVSRTSKSVKDRVRYSGQDAYGVVSLVGIASQEPRSHGHSKMKPSNPLESNFSNPWQRSYMKPFIFQRSDSDEVVVYLLTIKHLNMSCCSTLFRMGAHHFRHLYRVHVDLSIIDV